MSHAQENYIERINFLPVTWAQFFILFSNNTIYPDTKCSDSPHAIYPNAEFTLCRDELKYVLHSPNYNQHARDIFSVLPKFSFCFHFVDRCWLILYPTLSLIFLVVYHIPFILSLMKLNSVPANTIWQNDPLNFPLVKDLVTWVRVRSKNTQVIWYSLPKQILNYLPQCHVTNAWEHICFLILLVIGHVFIGRWRSHDTPKRMSKNV